MHLTSFNRTITIQLSPPERLWAVHLSGTIEIPLESLQSVRLERPTIPWWQEIRAPGTHLPGVLKAGTYYTELGREFWYVQGDQPCLCLELAGEYYRRIVIASDEAASWQSEIQARLDGLGSLSTAA